MFHPHRSVKCMALCALFIILSNCGAPTTVPTSTTPITRGKVDIGGFKLFIRCKGEGSPTVVLDAGWTMESSYWTAIISLITEETDVLVCAYDRLGSGSSDYPPLAPRTNLTMAQELHQLLYNANIQGPYIYVGHSLFGFTGRLFATEYPDDVAGLVLVDGSHPDWDAKMLEIIPPESDDEPKSVSYLRKGFEERRKDPLALQEFWDIPTSSDLVRASGSLGDLPLVILSRDPDASELQLAFNTWIFGGYSDFPLELSMEMDRVWVELQEELAGLSTNTTHIIVENTNHNIPGQDPESIVDAIRLVVDTYRDQ